MCRLTQPAITLLRKVRRMTRGDKVWDKIFLYFKPIALPSKLGA